MKTLSANWLTEHLVDFEYKKYILLAYLQGAKQEFEQKKLYPVFSDLFFHYENLQKVKENKELFYENFPQQISKADFQKLEIVYKKIIADDDLMKEIEDIIAYAMPRFVEMLSDGKEIYDFLETKIEISPVGITPIYFGEGYLFVNEFLVNDTKIYQYQITVFENTNAKYRGINVQYLETVKKSLGQSYENLKINMTRKYPKLPNPATFMVVAHIDCPLQESLLPIAKRSLVRYVSKLAA